MSRRQITAMKAMYLWIVLLSLALPVCGGGKNVLFIIADDMRPQLGCYHGPHFPTRHQQRMHTPSIDTLAAQSLLLERAYVQQASCNPSRTSVLTGRRPDTTKIHNVEGYFRDLGENYTTIPQFFKHNGYKVAGMGKVFHHGAASGFDDPVSWTEPYFNPPNRDLWDTRESSWRSVTREEEAKDELPDVQIAHHAVHTLRRLAPGAKNNDQPFFVAVGFKRPHMPFVIPQRFWDMYPYTNITLPPNPYAPVNMPDLAWRIAKELLRYPDINELGLSFAVNITLPDSKARELIRAYYGSVSYTDHLVGTVLAELKDLGLWDDTIIALFGDHGWHLGEHGQWTKHTSFEEATHAPMMIRVPGLTDHGIVAHELTEFVDLFPTVIEASGFPSMDLCPEDSRRINLCTEGSSLMPLMRAKGSPGKWKNRVFSQTMRINTRMGYTMKTTEYTYTEWVKFHKEPLFKPDWRKLYGVELYDYNRDPDGNYNVAHDADYAHIRRRLSRQLRAGWRAARV